MATCEVNGKASPMFALYMTKDEYELVSNLMEFAQIMTDPKKPAAKDLANVIVALQNPRKA